MRLASLVLLVGSFILGIAAPPADAARRIAIDLNTKPIQPCTFGSAAGCDPMNIGFNIFGGSGQATDIYIYSNGLVSIDRPLTATAPASLLDLGGNVMAAAFLPQVPQVWSVFAEQGWADIDPDTGLPIPGTNWEFRIDWYPDPTVAAPNPGPVQMRILNGCGGLGTCAWDGAVGVLYGYGGWGVICCDPEPDHPALLPAGTQIGIDADGLRDRVVFGPSSSLDDYEFTYVLAAVPEPAAWLQMLAGFLGIGLLLRRRRPERRPGWAEDVRG